ncbi:MAG: type II toxin-antitoxin system HicB family antitoxin [Neisseriaceae bacterium]|nr:type II toxin-antitoxin system HicB family antitoxin [Neisseriaceae bacterium]MBQ9682416.1 type II toxin-antitoxin system HicB family antitoxin [Neisseriaceae bacterium]MBR7002604.1 type II toxin-antitoxin system HicB family antitoxin [Neisseriaceae bacterium]
MNTLTYKGYTAKIEFDERDDIFVGRILGISDIVCFHADNVAEMKAEFALSVDEYIAACERAGKQPQKPASGRLMLRIPPEVHRAALIKAQASGKSLNQWAADTLANAVY